MKQENKQKTSKGFTLIEMLVVVLIIGILAAVALPNYITAKDKANYVTMMEAVRALKNEQEFYFLINGKYTDKISDLAGGFPAECNRDASDCGKFYLRVNNNTVYVYGVLKQDKVGVGNSYVAYLNLSNHSSRGQAHCYAYKGSGARGRRLCESLGGKKVSSGNNSSCDGYCTIYSLK